MEKPKITPGQWIIVDGINCVVCGVFTDSPWDAGVEKRGQARMALV